MTVSTTTASTGWLQGNGATTVFNYAFLIPFLSDGITPAILVYYKNSSGVITLLAASAYTVAGVGVAAGGSVTYNPGGVPIASGTYLQIVRNVAYSQLSSFDNQSFLPKSVESSLDNLELQLQQVYALLTLFSAAQQLTVATLPAPATVSTGARLYITDANATTFASIVAGGGTNKLWVTSNGTNWLIG